MVFGTGVGAIILPRNSVNPLCAVLPDQMVFLVTQRVSLFPHMSLGRLYINIPHLLFPFSHHLNYDSAAIWYSSFPPLCVRYTGKSTMRQYVLSND